MPPSSSTSPTSAHLDRLFIHSRREAIAILALWVICLVWSVGCSYIMGYNVDTEELSTVAGIPTWVFWGVGIPWLLATSFTIWFCFAYMTDDPLGDVAPDSEATMEPRDKPAHE